MSETIQTLIHKAPYPWDSGASVFTTNRLSGAEKLKRLVPYECGRSGNKLLRKRSAGILEHYLPKLATRLLQCGQVPHGQSDVELIGNGNGQSFFRGLKTCGSVWCCPDCSRKICSARKFELDQLLKHWRGNGVAVFMMTLTFAHSRKDTLQASVDGIKDAWVTLKQRAFWRKHIQPVVSGYVSATEVTYGANGWHPHLHIIIGVDIAADAGEKLLEKLRDEWESACFKYFLDASQRPAFDLRAADSVGQYVSKFGAAGEMTMATNKVGRKGSLTPWQLQRLAEGSSDPVDHRYYALLWREYAEAFHGKRQLVWSKGLKARVKIADVSDDEIAAVEPDADGMTVLRRWSSDAPSWIQARARSAQLLRAAADGSDIRAVEFGPTDDQVEAAWRLSCQTAMKERRSG